MAKAFAAAVIILLSVAAAAGAQSQDAAPGGAVYTATRTAGDPGNAPQSVTVIPGEDIRRSSATTVTEALQAAGILVADLGPKGALQTISMRGSDFSRVLILLDGARLNLPRDSGFDLSAIPVALEDIERIEIVRGPSSALYGPDAVGGVVNIITRRPLANQARIGGSLGSHGYDTLSAATDSRQGAWRLTLSGMRMTSDGYRQNSNLRQGIAGGRIGYDFSSTASLGLTARYLTRENGLPGSLALPSQAARQRERVRAYGLSYREQVSSTIDIRLSGSRIEDDLQSGDPAVPVQARHESTTDGGEAGLSWRANSWNLITLGYESRRDHLRSAGSGDHRASLEAGYLQDEIAVGDSFTLVAGERFDTHTVYGDRASPRISGTYRLRAGTALRASYGESFRAPTFDELYSSDPAAPGNPELRPESAKEYEAGVEQMLGRASVLRAAFFERTTTDLIVRSAGTTPAPAANVGRADVKGIEAEALFRLSEATALTAKYAGLKPVDASTGERIYAAAMPRSQITCALGMALDPDVFLHLERRAVEHYERPGEPLWRYAVMDGKLSQTLSDGKGEFFFGMKNILSRRYETVKGYPMPPKEIFGGISLVF